jgi:hypothetical protein
MALNPLTYGVAGLRGLIESPVEHTATEGPSLMMCVMVTASFAVVTVAVSVWMTRQHGGSHN